MPPNHTPNPNKSPPEAQEHTQLRTGGGPAGAHFAEFNPGDVIGGTYQVLRWIGAGGMGNVYCVRHTIMQTDYALKTLSADKVTEVAWRRFQNEAQAIARMSHPNIVGIYNLGLHDGRLPFYVMDLLKGQTLLDLLGQKGAMDTNQALGLFVELCSGFGYAHKKGIVHRDIKPPNIVLLDVAEPSCRVKIVDFGIAKLSGIKDPNNQYLTSAGEVCGSPYYMSPEQTEGQRIDGRSDIYSLGCTLFEVLTGAPPLRGRSAMDTMLMHVTTAPPTLKAASGGKEFPEMLEQVIATLLAKAPMDRYQTMELVAQDLSTILAGEQAAISPFSAQSHKQLRPADGTDQANKRTASGVRASDISAPRQYQTADEEDSQSHHTRALVAWFSLILLTLMGASGYWWYARKKPAAPAAVVRPAVEIDDRMLFTEVPKQLSCAREIAEPEDRHNQVPTTSLHDTSPFCHLAKVDGRQKRIFSFPEDITIGDINCREIRTQRSAAGVFSLDIKDPVAFKPDEVLLKYPGYLKRFQDGDISELKIEGESATDELFKLVSQLPGVVRVEFADCPRITAKVISDLDKMPSLRVLACYKHSLTAKDLSHMARLNSLPKVCFVNQADSDSFLELTQNSKALDYLDLHSSNVNHRGFEYIATLPNLTRLELNHAKFSSSDLQILSRVPKLEQLLLEDRKIDALCLQNLKKIKSLRRISIDHNSAFPLSDTDVCRALPGVQVAIARGDE